MQHEGVWTSNKWTKEKTERGMTNIDERKLKSKEVEVPRSNNNFVKEKHTLHKSRKGWCKRIGETWKIQSKI